MQVDDPPYLSVGTAVSAKYKGAFCEAKVSKVDRIVKCKVTFKMGLGNATVTDNDIKGTLRVGAHVQVKHPDRKDLVDATITKIQDCSQYTVVFDDGDITTLRRTALCLKSGRHFNESETLDQLPLTHPEHFGNPVVGGRRGRRNRQLKDGSSDEEIEEENEPDLEGYTQDIGRVVSVETGENKRGREKWFPGLIVIPSAQPTVKINVKDEFLIRSFRDDRYYTVPKKEVNEFSREQAERAESAGLQEAIQKAIKFLDHNELPLHWEKSSLFNLSADSDSYDNASESSEDEQSEEKDRFVAQLYKFMDESGTPLNKTPVISSKDIDLHRLFRVVHKLGGYNRVTNQNKWKSITGKLRLPVNQNISNQVKSVYRKCLVSYEAFHRSLGVTMFNPTRPKKSKGRSLIRDKDRTPMSSPRPERDDESVDKILKKETPVQEKVEPKAKKKAEPKEKEDSGRKSKLGEISDASSDVSEVASTSSIRPKRYESKQIKEKVVKPPQGEKVKLLVEKFEESEKKIEKVQNTRSKTISTAKGKEVVKEPIGTRQNKETVPLPVKTPIKVVKKVVNKEELEERDKKLKQRKKTLGDGEKLPSEGGNTSSSSSSSSSDGQCISANIGDKLIIYYGPTNESKVTYEAKVVDIDKDQSGPIYLVHYTGWNTRYDEWIPGARIAENLNSGVRLKRTKIPAAVNVKPAPSGASTSGTRPTVGRRSRVMSVSSRAPPDDKPPRSTTPSSVTSNSSRTKSPATPATRSSRLAARQESSNRRRISAQTDASIHSDSNSDSSESENELPRTRSGSLKSEEPEVRVYKKRAPKSLIQPSPIKGDKRKDKTEEDDTDKEDEVERVQKDRRVKKIKKSSEKFGDESDEDSLGHPKGRDFDLNQIRSELKGFSKTIKASTVEIEDKENALSSDDSSSAPNLVIKEEKEDIKLEESKPSIPSPLPSPKLEKSSSSEDIYEFKEPEPFEFESRSKLADEKNSKKRMRIFQDLDKIPKKKGGRSPMSPEKSETKLDLPEPKTYSRIPKPVHISDEEEEDELLEDDKPEVEEKNEDPFDKLIVSPSFNIIKTSPDKPPETRPVSNILDVSLTLFGEVPEMSDEYSRDMELSDCESQTQILTRENTLFNNPFSKSSERNSPDLEFSTSKIDEGKTLTSDDEDIQAQIKRVIEQSSSSDDDSNGAILDIDLTSCITPAEVKKPVALLRLSPTPVQIKEPVVLAPSPVKELTVEKEELDPIKLESPIDTMKPVSPKKPIDPALQETDSSLLESIFSNPPLILNPQLDDTGKEFTIKTGTRIADSILEKFNSIKNNFDLKTVKSDPSTNSSLLDSLGTKTEKIDMKPAFTLPIQLDKEPEPSTSSADNKPKLSVETKVKSPAEDKLKEEIKIIENKIKLPETGLKGDLPSCSTRSEIISSKRKRVISKAYIDESDSDSSDSDNLIIARSDDDSGTNSSDNKPLIEIKESTDSNMSVQKTITTDDSQSQPEEEKRSFNFDDVKGKKDTGNEAKEIAAATKIELEVTVEKEVKEENAKEEQDPNLHSLLLCEEEFPRSPAPAPEVPNPADIPSSSSMHEMPFASAPSSSNCKMLMEQKKVVPPLVSVVSGERENKSDAQVEIENIPPTTPESSSSNLSPRGENGNISPNSNDSSKSNEGEPEFRTERRNSAIKVTTYSEEDTQIGDLPPSKKSSENPCGPPIGCRKRRRSLRTSEDGNSQPSGPAKRGRKPLASRQRRDSDSDDASENSVAGSTGGHTPVSGNSLYDRAARSPRPSKYNFFVEFDPSLDSGQRIALLQQKLSDLRKTYADVKAELATVERRRKKIRRREREALKSSKQEMACA
ncbi:AT-rich interactive domain-containing protein 4A-like isoform X2 [Sitophilus oryzae]|uniref:AT-rich interactive domain-containing protein 4A-like isoform X2 n=1 Tax=Sitophilus oryzae TaxID=7048 RepID=A0A6J2YID9_SITOR|nr:AT-rich interactive domain-containing protein 4A-like isoform X2 [Sitophilus oryzae]